MPHGVGSTRTTRMEPVAAMDHAWQHSPA